MKCILKFVVLIILLFPAIVFASGSSDDDTMGLSHMNINCVYEQQSVIPQTHGEYEGNGTYINIEFVGIDDTALSGSSFTYSFGKLNADGKFEKNYEYSFASGCDNCGRWLNYNKGYGSEYNLQAWWSNLMHGEDYNTLPGSEIQQKADNGDFCPQQVLIVQEKEEGKYYFISARDTQDRLDSSNELMRNGKYKNFQIYYFTGTSLAISNINQNSYEETNTEEKVEEGKQNVKAYCDKSSSSYDEKKCAESKIVSNSTEDTANNIVSYDPKSLDELKLSKIYLGKITCDTLFKNNGKYNNTHELLSTTLKFMQYIGIILALVLSTIDFVKVIPTQDKDAIKKASSKAVTRLIIAIVIFFVPIILDFILGLVGFNNPTCSLL